jgi:hypothetical protein
MADFGTAPRKIGDVWYTRTGRRLSPAGQHWWETRRRLGATSGQGDFDPTISRRITQAQQGPTRATRVAAGKALGAEAKRQQEQLQAQGRNNPLNPLAPIPQVIHGIQTRNPVEAGLGAMAVLPAGRGFRLIREGAEAVKGAGLAARAVEKSPQQILPAASKEAQRVGEAFAGAKKEIRASEAARRTEFGQRAGKRRGEFEAAGGGLAGHFAAKSALKGRYEKLPFNQLRDLDPQTMDRIADEIEDLPHLMPGEKTNLTDAIVRAQAGHLPRNFEVKLMGKAFGEQAALEFRGKRTAAEVIADVANIPRSLMATGDLSYRFRQGLMAFAHSPGKSLRRTGQSLPMTFSKEQFDKYHAGLLSDAEIQDGIERGLAITDVHGNLPGREEAFGSPIAEKLTGGRFSPVRAANRNFTGNAIRDRAEIYKGLLEKARGKGVPVDDHLKDSAAKMANWATGRGNWGHRQAEMLTNAFFFSPKLFKSRVDAINPWFYKDLHPFVRNQAAGTMARLVGGGTAALGAAYGAGKLIPGGPTVGLDPTSSDWGKIRVGNTRFDIWGGHQQLARTFAQEAAQRIKSSTTGETTHFGRGHWFDPVGKFVEGKLSPPASLGLDVYRGHMFGHQPLTLRGEAQSKGIPLLWQDTWEAAKKGRSPWMAAPVAGLGAFGVGTQTYKDKPRDPATGRFVKPGSLPHINRVGVRLGHGEAGVRIGGGAGSGVRLGSGRSGSRLQHIDQVGKRLGH